MNSVELTGNLTRDPVIRYTKSGMAVAAFSIGVNRKYTDKNGQEQSLADFINIAAWDKLAEAVGAELHKGDRVHVYGRLSSRSYDDRDGRKVYVTEVVASEISRPLFINKNNGGYGYGTQSRSAFTAGTPPTRQAPAGYNSTGWGAARTTTSSGTSSFARFGKPKNTEGDIPF